MTFTEMNCSVSGTLPPFAPPHVWPAFWIWPQPKFEICGMLNMACVGIFIEGNRITYMRGALGHEADL